MVRLKNNSKGFTIVELLIVIVVIGILATLVIVTFTGIQQKARDSKRKTDLNALDSHAESFFASYGFYPSLADLQDTGSGGFDATFLKGFDTSALTDPKGGSIAASTSANAYGYTASGSDSAATCSNTTKTTITNGVPQDNGCVAFQAQATLEAGGTYTKKSN